MARRIRCDKPMRRSKEQTNGSDEFGIQSWRCTGECARCICAIVMNDDGRERHVMLRGGNRFVKVYDTANTSNQKEQ